MNKTERITYIELAFQAELDPVIQVIIFTEEEWEHQFLANPDVDPLNVHKQYGLTSPQLVNNVWTVGVSAAHLIKPFEDEDDTGLHHWIEYWAYHTFCHLIVLEFAVILGDQIRPAKEESDVEALFEEQEPALYSFGGEVRMLNPSS